MITHFPMSLDDLWGGNHLDTGEWKWGLLKILACIHHATSHDFEDDF